MEPVEQIFSRICRTCKCEEADMISVFASAEKSENPRVDEMLMACASVEVNLGDGLPDLICVKCIDQLNTAYCFKIQCEKTDNNLREFAKVNKDDVKPVIHPVDTYLENIEKLLTKPVETSASSLELQEPEVKENHDDENHPITSYDFIQLLDNNQMLLTCRECSKIFTTLEGLKCHKRIHSGTQFKCKFCEKAYTRKNHLERHEATHIKKKVHVCRICNKTLTRFEHLKRHLTTHLREKPFTCQKCNRGFSRLEHLNNHVVRCKGERVHVCNICNKAFMREISLEVHRKVHSNDQPVLPTLENLDNIEEHYYEIDYMKSMEFSDESDTESSTELADTEIKTRDEQDEDSGRENTDDNDPNREMIESPTEPLENIEVSISESVEEKPIEDQKMLNDDHIDGVEEKEEKSLLTTPKREISDDEYIDNYLPEVAGDDDSNSDTEYLPTKFEPPKVKRGRGRPRKNPLKVVGRKRGRPPTKRMKKEPEEEVEEEEVTDIKEEKTGVYPCPAPDCGASFENESKLEKHARKHDGLRLYTCGECSKQFARSNHLKRHMKSHSVEKPFQCEKCKKCFNRKDHLTQHQRLHERTQEYICEVCQKSFYKLGQLAKHQAAKHGIGERLVGLKKYDCEVCSKSFTTEKYRDIHLKGHTGEKQHACRICTKEFLSKSHLNEHMKFHNENSKKFLCSECGQRFIRNDYLVIHMRRHRGEKPFKCKFCGKGFPRTTDLTVHERYHTGEKTHLCTICGRGFGRAYNLTVHMRTHTGEKPYQCTYCDAAFAQGNDLKAHVRRHTGERFHCELCPESFLMGYLLTQHKRAVHGLNVVSNIRRLNPVHKKEEGVDDPPPITIPLPKPIISDPLLTYQAQITVAQLQHHMAQE